MSPATKSAPTKRSSAKSGGFTDAERAAMRERAREMKAERQRGSKGKAAGEADVLEKIAQMKVSDRVIAERLHALVKETAPSLSPKTWYGMPAYAKDDKIVCYFQCAEKFKSRYATLGFSDKAKLDDGTMWPVVYALKQLTSTEEKKIAKLLRQAVS